MFLNSIYKKRAKAINYRGIQPPGYYFFVFHMMLEIDHASRLLVGGVRTCVDDFIPKTSIALFLVSITFFGYKSVLKKKSWMKAPTLLNVKTLHAIQAIRNN